MSKFIWKFKFCFWFIYFKGYKHINMFEWASICYHENHSGTCEVYTPRQAAGECINWAMK